MKNSRCVVVMVVAALTLGAGRPGAQNQASGDRVTVPFSDPSRPGAVVVSMVSGGMSIRAVARRDVLIESTPGQPEARDKDGAAGLRRLTSPRGLVVEEENNEVTVRTGGITRRATLQIEVPQRTNLKLRTVTDGEIVVEGVQGEIEANTVNSSITLTNVAGSVVAHTTNGKVVATIRQLTPDTPMAFTSFNGSVDVTLPPTARASLRMRTDNGDVFSDFDVQLKPGAATAAVRESRRDRRYRIEVDPTVVGAINGGGPEFELRTFNGNVYLRRGAR